MNKLLFKALVASMFFVVLTGTTALAQLLQGNVDVDIPFRFYAGDTWLPAGKYMFLARDIEQPNLLLIQNANDSVEVFLSTHPVISPVTLQTASVDFDRIGGKEFLSTIWVDGRKGGFQLDEPRLEVKFEKAAMKKERHSIQAHHNKP